jgi:hypothetical protein
MLLSIEIEVLNPHFILRNCSSLVGGDYSYIAEVSAARNRATMAPFLESA